MLLLEVGAKMCGIELELSLMLLIKDLGQMLMMEVLAIGIRFTLRATLFMD